MYVIHPVHVKSKYDESYILNSMKPTWSKQEFSTRIYLLQPTAFILMYLPIKGLSWRNWESFSPFLCKIDSYMKLKIKIPSKNQWK